MAEPTAHSKRSCGPNSRVKKKKSERKRCSGEHEREEDDGRGVRRGK